MRRNKRAQVPVGVEGGGDSEPSDRAMANPLAANPLPVPADADGARAADTGAESFEIEGVVESPASTGQDEATGDGLAQRIFLLFDEPESSRAATIVSSVVLLLILVSSVVFVVETIPEVHRHPTLVSTFEAVELACIVAFTIEYLVRVATCARRPAAVAAGTPPLRATLSYVLGVMPLVDLVSILPYYIGIFLDSGGSLAVLRVLRMARVFRVFRAGSLAKDMHMLSDSLSRGKDGLVLFLFMFGIYVTLFSSFLYMMESGHRGDKGGFESIPASMWFVISTMTTVGYGDVYPLTMEGQLMSALCMLCGIIVLALPISIIGSGIQESFFEEEKQQRKAAREAQEEQDLRDGVTPARPEVALATAAELMDALYRSTDDDRFLQCKRILVRPPE